MESSILHIIHGDGLKEQVDELNLKGKKVIWRELLCEGQTDCEVGSRAFITKRQDFLENYYSISNEVYADRFLAELDKLKISKEVGEINLWFEFDLYNHINMIAVIDFLIKQNSEAPVFLVCSRRLKGDGKDRKGLARLNKKQLMNHFEKRFNLTPEDLEYASLIWSRYCVFDHKKLKPEIRKPTNFEYLSSCMKAHIERFPNRKTGLNSVETNVLKLIDKHTICNTNQLLGYALEYQGYYGYSFDQMQRLIGSLQLFYTSKKQGFALNDNGEAVLNQSKNFYRQMKNGLYYGGADKFGFLYDPDSHNLMKL